MKFCLHFIHYVLDPWIPLGKVDFSKTGSVQTYSFADAGVPGLAKEVLIYVTLRTGYNESPDADIHIALWTTDGMLQYKKYLFNHLYPQVAWSCNSENMFFPVGSCDLTLYAQVMGPEPKAAFCSLFLIGYRL